MYDDMAESDETKANTVLNFIEFLLCVKTMTVTGGQR